MFAIVCTWKQKKTVFLPAKWHNSAPVMRTWASISVPCMNFMSDVVLAKQTEKDIKIGDGMIVWEDEHTTVPLDEELWQSL